jgi:probable rRNA maturation factor
VTAPPETAVEVIVEDDRWAPLDLPRLASVAAGATLARLGLDTACEIALLAASDARVAGLNEGFRGKPEPTNVLSWPAEDLAPETPGGEPARPEAEFPGEPLFLGDIALAWETCAAEAAAADRPVADHVTHLVVHALLHLLGYDHQTEADAARMEGLEVEILAALGLPDPY